MPTTFELVAFDPGGTTGFARFDVEDDNVHLIEADEFPLWKLAEELIWRPRVRCVTYENIVPRSLDFNPIGLQVIGVIRYVCELVNIEPTAQPNAVIHGVEKWGIYDLSRIHSVHARDATMHGIVWLRRRGFKDISLG